MKKYNFISGLPRAGSTLLSSILNQNPHFSAGISDCIHSYTHSIIQDTDQSVGVGTLVPIEKRKEIIRGIFDSYYSDKNEVCFNTNRAWTADTYLLKSLFPDFRMIVMIRNIEWILNSFEHLHQKNPYTIKPLYHHKDLPNSMTRCAMLMGELGDAGYVKGPLDCVMSSVNSAEAPQIVYVTYGSLVKQPEKTMRSIYEFIGEEYFEHDFKNVDCQYDDFDNQAKIDGLHTVRKEVSYKEQKVIIPDNLFEHYSQFNVLNNIDTNLINLINYR
jgi:sulfotransferase